MCRNAEDCPAEIFRLAAGQRKLNCTLSDPFLQ